MLHHPIIKQFQIKLNEITIESQIQEWLAWKKCVIYTPSKSPYTLKTDEVRTCALGGMVLGTAADCILR